MFRKIPGNLTFVVESCALRMLLLTESHDISEGNIMEGFGKYVHSAALRLGPDYLI